MKTFLYVVNSAMLIITCLFAIFINPWIWIAAVWIAIWLALDFYNDYRIDKAWQKLRALSSKNLDV